MLTFESQNKLYFLLYYARMYRIAVASSFTDPAVM